MTAAAEFTAPPAEPVPTAVPAPDVREEYGDSGEMPGQLALFPRDYAA
jgi:hypothetical protein